MCPSFLHHLDQTKEQVWMQAMEYTICRAWRWCLFCLVRAGECSVWCPAAVPLAPSLQRKPSSFIPGLVSKSFLVLLCLGLGCGCALVCSKTLILMSFSHSKHCLAFLHVLDFLQDHSQYDRNSDVSLQGNACRERPSGD